MASGLLPSIQSLSTKLLEAICGNTAQTQDSTSPDVKSVSDDLVKLSRMLARIDAVLLDAEERQIHDRSVRLWLDELRGVAYQAEDVLDEFHYEFLKSIVDTGDTAIQMYHRDRGSKRKFAEMCTSSSLASSSSTITKTSIPHGMSEKINSIKERFEEISNSRRDLNLRVDDGTRVVTVPQVRPPTSSFVDERGIFGRESEKEQIINLLKPSNDSDFMVLPIVGMGGLGKTTLAQLIYNDSIFGQLFQEKAWVYVSEDFDLVRLTRAIIESISNSACHFSELSKLQEILNNKLRGVSVFLVLDDVWNEKRNIWECFRVAFHSAKTVRILATTRNKLVAEIMQTISYFPLGCLPEDRCWLLFEHFAFDNKEASENPNLLEIGHGIVKKCNGLPLANKVLGGMLRYERDVKKWREVLESDIPEIDETGDIMPTLWLSYKKLPLYLRPCFLFLSMFPKGKRFNKDKVVRLWMAHGYINGNLRSKKTLEEIGSEYFDELLGRSLIDCYRNKHCLHDLIHDLASSASKRANGSITEDDQQWISSCKVHHIYLAKQDDLSGFLEPKIYRAIRTIIKDFPRSYTIDSNIFCNIACVRALELSSEPETLWTSRNYVLPDALGLFKHLRYLSIGGDWMIRLPDSLCLLFHLQSLHLQCPNIQVLPKKIKNLVNLRYFGLSSHKIKQLPESVCMLCNLNTLTLEGCRKFNRLPSNIKLLTNLHVLNLNLCPRISIPFGTGKLSNLKTLCGHFLVMEDNTIGGLRELENMNKLSGFLCISGLKNIGNMEYSRKANLISKPNLRKLILNFEEDVSFIKSFIKKDYYEDNVLHVVICSSTEAKNKIDESTQEGVLESLQPHGNLTDLEIVHYKGRTFPPWLLDPPLMSKLTTLTLHFHNECTFLPSLFGQFLHLKCLKICGSVDTMSKLGEEHLSDFLFANYLSKVPAIVSFPSLEELSFNNVLNLVEWQACDGRFPCLKKLAMHHCPKVQKVFIPQKVEVLEVNSCGCQEIMFSSQSKLKKVSISDCKKLTGIHYKNDGLPILESISLSGCPNLLVPSIMPRELKHIDINDCSFQEINFSSLFKLQQISISNCKELIAIHYKNGDSPVLESISFSCCPNLSIPLVIPQELKKIDIDSCGFQELNFSSHSKLQRISISDCKELVSIYYKNGGFPVLSTIKLHGCPRLLIFSAIIEDRKQLDIRDCGFQEIKFPSIPRIPGTSISYYKELFSDYELTEINSENGENVIKYIPVLWSVSLRDCPKLRIFSAIPTELKYLTIHNCGFHEIMLPSRCQRLSITTCLELSSMYWTDEGLNALNQIVTLVNCPQLELLKISKEVNKLIIISCGIHEIMFPSESKIASIYVSQCPELNSLFLDGNLPLLEKLSIKSCPQFCDVLTISNQLKELDISDSSVPEICILPKSRLHKLFITSCIRLASIKGLQARNLLLNLHISQCPILQFSMNDVLHPMMELICIYDSPKVDLGSQGKGCFYQKNTITRRIYVLDDKMNCPPDSSADRGIPLLENSRVFFVKEDTLKAIKELGHVSLGLVSCQYIQLYLPSLVELQILNCSKVIKVTGLDNLYNLKQLIISDCQELCEWKDQKLPLALQFLKLVSCCKLSCAPLRSVDNHPRTLEIIIADCPLMTEW